MEYKDIVSYRYGIPYHAEVAKRYMARYGKKIEPDHVFYDDPTGAARLEEIIGEVTEERHRDGA